ncbi:tryptophan halogenase family protein [Qipengyuania sp.]|uniref:tryptophan halogenase family protein n=1 Tax=Qipengyuania sp. TaxID=2004515 RepID=UPI0035C81266
MTAPKLRSVVILGGGTAGWMAAAALSRFAPHLAVTLVESEAIGTVGVGEATIPQIRLFNSALGIDEGEFLRETKGSFKLGIEFAGWTREGESYMHAFGAVGRPVGLLPFQHHWLRASKLGFAGPLARYSANEQAARATRVPPAGRKPPATDLPYAYHFDASLYAALLRRHAEGRGATRVEGRVASVVRDGERGDIAALHLENGTEVAGDFFIDCSGFRGRLIEEEMRSGYDDWTHWLPCDRALAVACASGGEFTPYTRSTARQAGWQWRIPLQHRIGNGYVYASAHISDDEAAAMLMVHLDGAPQGDPRAIRFTTGKRRSHWRGNCLALGLAAGFLEPLESTSIHLTQSAINRFLSVLPEGRPDHAIVDWFNAQADFEWSRVRDFIILHYWANERQGETFWDGMRALDLPATLTEKIAAWKAGAFIHREHEELFTEVGWFQVLVGQHVQPHGYNPIADAIPEHDLRRLLDETEAAISDSVPQMPVHADVLRTIITRAGIVS